MGKIQKIIWVVGLINININEKQNESGLLKALE